MVMNTTDLEDIGGGGDIAGRVDSVFWEIVGYVYSMVCGGVDGRVGSVVWEIVGSVYSMVVSMVCSGVVCEMELSILGYIV